MSTISLPYTLTDGSTAYGSQVQSNLTTIVNDYNGSISNANISGSAAIDASKLNLSSIAQTISISGSPINLAKGSDLASASTVSIGTASGNYVHITGTTTITAFDTIQAGVERILIFDGALTLTHNATSLILPTGASITTAAGDMALMISEGSGNWRCVDYQRKDGSPLTPFTAATAPSGSILQVKYQIVTSTVTCNTQIPFDNSIPQNTEGNQILTLSITPNNASNILRITANASYTQSSGVTAGSTIALFQDSTAGALAAAIGNASGSAFAKNTTLVHLMAAGTTSSTTFNVRLGPDTAVTLYLNGDTGGTRVYGGVCNSVLMIEEIKA